MTQTQHDKNQTDIARLMAETLEVSRAIRWYEVVVITALVVAVITITKLFF